ncbi:hypothetical protein [Nonomuraea polychroma]|uniref:hypothetical protein n=1 Tax=Nonomuraea polychroma TaxID=46176 RepID=UPI0019D4AF8E|nr:hypothetical protein [Nonomuraea polychroma]
MRDMFEISPGDTLLLRADIGKGIAVPSQEMVVGLVETIFGEPSAAKFDDKGETDGSG